MEELQEHKELQELEEL
jgi:hypothetical protein